MRTMGWVMLVGSLVADTAVAVFMAPDFFKLVVSLFFVPYALLGVGMITGELWKAGRPWGWWLAAGMGGVLCVAYVNLVYTYWYALPVRFLLAQPGLERDVARLRQGERVDGWRSDGNPKHPDTSLAYALGGVLHRWHGFVYDPLDRLADLAGPGPIGPSAGTWFDSRLISVEQLGRHWYLCEFR